MNDNRQGGRDNIQSTYETPLVNQSVRVAALHNSTTPDSCPTLLMPENTKHPDAAEGRFALMYIMPQAKYKIYSTPHYTETLRPRSKSLETTSITIYCPGSESWHQRLPSEEYGTIKYCQTDKCIRMFFVHSSTAIMFSRSASYTNNSM